MNSFDTKLNALKNNLQQYSRDKNFSLREIARRSGVSDSTIQNIMNGRSKNPGIKAIDMIARELGCSFEELIGEINQKGKEFKTDDKHTKQMLCLKNKEWNLKHFIDCLKYIDNVNLEQGQIYSSLDILHFAIEVYLYSAEEVNEVEKTNCSKFDEKFAKYLLETIM